MRCLMLTAALLLVAVCAQAGELQPGRLFARVPPPPPTLAAAVSRVAVSGGSEPKATAPAYERFFAQLHAATVAGGNAAGQQQMARMGLDIDFQRLQSDPAYAARMQQRMAGMSVAEKMAMAQRMMAAQSGAGRGMPQQLAHAKVITFLSKNKQANHRALMQIDTMFRRAVQAARARQEVVARRIKAALERCPSDQTGEELVASCADPLRKKALREHRRSAKQSLAEELAVFARAQKLARARVEATLPMLAQARQAGDATDVAIINGEIGRFTRTLADYGRAVTLGAAFWGNPHLESRFVFATQLQFAVWTKKDLQVDWSGMDYP